jgi:dihydrolipoamide dehydrogenase
MSTDTDLVIIGSGPGGYVAAIRAAQLGLAVTLVEKDPHFGGTCLHRGCIPTKALLHTAEVLDGARKAARFGVQTGEPTLDLGKAHGYKKKVVRKNAKGVEYLLRSNSVTTIHGSGSLAGPGEVRVLGEDGETRVRARWVLIATGSRPQPLGIAPVDGDRVLDSDQILTLDRVPASLAVLGAGAVGVEFASIFTSFGSQVTLVELLPRVLPLEDEDSSAALEKALRRRGVDIRTSTGATEVVAGDDSVRIGLESGGEAEQIEVDTLLVAVGRRPVTEGLGLEELGVEMQGPAIVVDEYMRTSLGGVYAIGDVVPTPQLAHLASAEGLLAVEHMAGREPRPIDYDLVPGATYSDPEVASVGLSEAEAIARGHDVATGTFPFSASGKAAILECREGFVKVVREKTDDQVLGVHIVGPRATELIAEACVALKLEATNEELFRTIHAHPTLSEAMMEAGHVAAGEGIHIVS